MKLPFSKVNPVDGSVSFRCKKHHYLPGSEFYESDLKNKRQTCKVCTKERAYKSRQQSEEKKVLVRFRTWALRHGHDEVKKWELSDIEPILGTTEELTKNIVLRPINHNSTIYCPQQMKIVLMEDVERVKISP